MQIECIALDGTLGAITYARADAITVKNFDQTWNTYFWLFRIF